jgi:copper chaperone CopZ
VASTHLKTMGMACEACSALVEMNLEHLQGVISARTDLGTGLTTVLYDPHEVDGLGIADEIERSGFRARLISYPQFVEHGDTRPTPGAEQSAGDQGPSAAARTKRADLHAVHVRTSGLRCGECTALVEQTLGHLDGVVGVTAVRSLGLTSILYDEDRVDKETIAGAIRRAGFGAEVVR